MIARGLLVARRVLGTRLPLLLVALVALVAIALGTGIGCERRETDDGAAPVDTALMAFLSEARAYHHKANLAEESGDLAGAASAMDRLVHARRPETKAPVPEVEEVLADAYARLAEIELRRSDLDRSAAAVKEGLAHAPAQTYFYGHLVEIQGLLEEARANVLADAGKTEEAARTRAHAMELLEDVIRIQDQVIQNALARDAGKTGSRR